MKAHKIFVFPLLIVAVGCASDNASSAEAGSGTENGSSETDTEDSGSEAFFTEGERSTILDWLGPMPAAPPADPSNRFADDDAAAELGQLLFFDPGYSETGNVSCATCHVPDLSFADARANTSEGISFTERSTISPINGAYGAAAEDQPNWQFWDGRTDSQWAQALGPPEDPIEMGGTRTAVAMLIFDNYRTQYEAIAGPMPQLRDASGTAVAPLSAKPGNEDWDALDGATQQQITDVYVNFGKFIAAYERRLISHRSRFDEFWEELSAQPDSDIFTEEEKQGLRIFISEGRCLGCHGGRNFTDGQFHNIAVPQLGANVPETDRGRADGIVAAMEGEFMCTSEHSDVPDPSQCAVNQVDVTRGELGAFKTPSLRNVAQTGPYMHTGTFTTLEQVIMHYDTGGSAGPFEGTRDELMRPLGLSAPNRRALVAFLRTLDGQPIDPSLLGGQ